MIDLVASTGVTVGQAIVDAINLGCLYALFALGIALIFGVMGLINFAHGELVMVGAYVAVYLVGLGEIPAVLLAVVCVVALAVIMERIAFRPLRGQAAATLLVGSFGLSIVLQNGAELAFGALPKGTGLLSDLTQVYMVGAIAIPKLSVVTVALTVGLLVALGAFLKLTDVGVQMRAAAENFPMARLMGVRANRLISISFAISGLLAGAASVLVIAQTGSAQTTMGVNIVVIAFVATILGGAGSLAGAVVGGLLVGALTVVLQTTLPLDLRPFRDSFVFALVLATLVLRPQGLVVLRSRQQRV